MRFKEFLNENMPVGNQNLPAMLQQLGQIMQQMGAQQSQQLRQQQIAGQTQPTKPGVPANTTMNQNGTKPQATGSVPQQAFSQFKKNQEQMQAATKQQQMQQYGAKQGNQVNNRIDNSIR